MVSARAFELMRAEFQFIFKLPTRLYLEIIHLICLYWLYQTVETSLRRSRSFQTSFPGTIKRLQVCSAFLGNFVSITSQIYQ